MIAIDFPEANVHYGKPDDMTDEECLPISAYQGVDAKGRPYINCCYMPSKEDIEAILAGSPIVMSMMVGRLIPHSLFTFDEHGNLNE